MTTLFGHGLVLPSLGHLVEMKIHLLIDAVLFLAALLLPRSIVALPFLPSCRRTWVLSDVLIFERDRHLLRIDMFSDLKTEEVYLMALFPDTIILPSSCSSPKDSVLFTFLNIFQKTLCAPSSLNTRTHRKFCALFLHALEFH